jgi:peroxiredoxin
MSRPLVIAVLLLCLVCCALAGTLPRKAPEFTINLTNGQKVPLSQFQGKVLAVVFILTYCEHCQKTIGLLSKDQAEYGPRGFQVVASAIQDGAAPAVPDFLKKFHPPFPVGYNARSEAINFLQHPFAERLIMPRLVFIDRSGMIQAQYGGDSPFLVEHQEENLRAKIEELLAAPAPAGKKSGKK